MPAFSVVLPNYNYARYLPETISSVLNQTEDDFELLVVDDCSTDHSREVVGACTDPRVSLLSTSSNSGVSAALNLGLLHARADAIAVLGADDRMVPGFLRAQGEALADQNVDICGTYVNEIDGGGRSSSEGGLETWFNTAIDLNAPQSWIWQNRLAHSSTVVRRSVVERVGLYDEDLPIAVDWNYWIRSLAAGCRFHVVPQRLIDLRHHGGNMTHASPERLLRSYAQTSARYMHPTLRAHGHEDLVATNVQGFLEHPLVRDRPDLAADLTATLSGDPVVAELIGRHSIEEQPPTAELGAPGFPEGGAASSGPIARLTRRLPGRRRFRGSEGGAGRG